MKELEKIIRKINDNDYKTILLQFPEGLKRNFKDIVNKIEDETNASLIISANPCYGACDIEDINNIKADLIIQFGHSEIPELTDKYNIPVEFCEYRSELDIIEIVEKSLNQLKKNVGLVTTVQHVHQLSKLSKFLKEKGFNPIIGKGDSRIKYDGQILGCNFSSATSINDKLDSFLYIGSGNFHPLGVAIATNKNVIIADPYSQEIREINNLKEKILRQRYGAIEIAMNAETFGILIGLKKGQERVKLANYLKEIVEKKDKKAFLFALREFEPMYLSTFNVDIFVSTACPRIAIDDYLRYKKPLITPIELEIALGLKKWEDYKMDEIF